jgi:hypothetical protein
MAQPAESGCDVERDIIVALPAGKPRPRAVAQLHLSQFAQRRFGFAVEAIIIEKDADVSASLAFAFGLAHPGRFLD